MTSLSEFLRPIAHRGLHDVKAGIIENTAPAFEAAIAERYGIECDLRAATGGLPIVFHDAMLDRLVDGKGPVNALTTVDLARLRHRVCGSKILTFDELLSLVRGRVPLLVEIKSEWEAPDPHFIAHIAASAENYDGPIALMSFDPAVMELAHAKAPSIPWGIVSGSYKGNGYWADKISPERAARLRDLAEPCGPDEPNFYAYEVSALPTDVTEHMRRKRDKPLFTWTVRTAEQRETAAKWADAMIFEGFRP